MLPLLATSLATVVGVMLFGGDFSRLFFVFPTYQITSFRVVDYSVSLPSWMRRSPLAPRSVWSAYKENFCKDKGTWRCLVWDWEAFSLLVNNIEADMLKFVATWREDEQLSTTLSPKTDIDEHSSFAISAEIHAGISINNSQNAFGAHVQKSLLDIYHETWDGTLVNIGLIQDRESGSDVSLQMGKESDSTLFVVTPEQSLSLQECVSTGDNQNTVVDGWRNESPSFTISPRQTVHTSDDAISVHLRNLSPNMLFSMAYQLIRNGRVLHITSSAVIYLKTLASSVPITAGAICDNTLRFSPSISRLMFHGKLAPWIDIDEVNCRIQRLTTGWGNITKVREELTELVLKRGV